MSDRTGDTRGPDNRGTQTRDTRSPGIDRNSSSNSSSDIDSFEREADEYDDAAQAGPDGDLDLDLEAPEADTAEQRAELLQQQDEPITARPSDRDGEADPADTAEQRRVVAVDEDDYR